MPPSMRVCHAGSVEIHLKNQMEVPRNAADEVASLPSKKNWFILKKNVEQGEWRLVGSSNEFNDADTLFVEECRSEGVERAKPLSAGGTGGESRVINA